MTVLVGNLLVAAFLAGVIWVVQVVHYPLFDGVGEAQWVAYEEAHRVRISVVVAVPMLLSIALAVAVLGTGEGAAALRWLNLALAAIPFVATFLLFVPLHDVLSQRWDAAAHEALVQRNWLRTIAWTAQAGVATALVLQAARG